MNKVTKIKDNEYSVGLFTVTFNTNLEGTTDGIELVAENATIVDDEGEVVELDTLKVAIVEKITEYNLPDDNAPAMHLPEGWDTDE